MVGIKPLLAAVVMVAVALSGCTADGANFTEPAPQWRAGYAWSYDTTVEGEYTVDEDGEIYNDTWDESYREVLEVLNTTQTLDGRDVYLVAHQMGEWGNSLVAVRTDDLTPMWLEWDDCDDADCLAPLEFEAYVEHDQVPRLYDFPLGGGSSWADTLRGDDEIDIDIQIASRVAGVETLTTPLGEVDTIVVQRTMRILNLDAVLQMLREEIESEGGRVIRLDGDFRADITDHYAPVYQNTVRSVTVETSRFHLEIEYEGERFSGKETSRGTYTTALAGASLSPGPEQSLNDVADYLMGRVRLDDPAGIAVIDAGYTLGIDTVRDEVNVAEGEALRFAANIEGELPAEHSLEWYVLDQVGSTVARASGPVLDAVPGHPGSYTVVLQSQAAGQVVQGAATTGLGHYRTTLTAACSPVEVSGQGVPSSCESQSIPVRPGIESLDIQAMTSSPADAANQASIRLTDSMGNVIDARSYGDAKHIVLEDEIYAHAVSASDWDLDWFQQVGVLEEQVIFNIDLTYGGDVPFVVAVEAGTVPPVPGALPAWLQGDVSFL